MLGDSVYDRQLPFTGWYFPKEVVQKTARRVQRNPVATCAGLMRAQLRLTMTLMTASLV